MIGGTMVNIKTIDDLNDIDIDKLSLEELERIYEQVKDILPTTRILATSNGVICYTEKEGYEEPCVPHIHHKRMTAKKRRNPKWRNGKKK